MSVSGISNLANVNMELTEHTIDIWAEKNVVLKKKVDAMHDEARRIRKKAKMDGIFGAIGSAFGAIGAAFNIGGDE